MSLKAARKCRLHKATSWRRNRECIFKLRKPLIATISINGSFIDAPKRISISWKSVRRVSIYFLRSFLKKSLIKVIILLIISLLTLNPANINSSQLKLGTQYIFWMISTSSVHPYIKFIKIFWFLSINFNRKWVLLKICFFSDFHLIFSLIIILSENYKKSAEISILYFWRFNWTNFNKQFI